MADRRLLQQAREFYAELSRFVDLAEGRREKNIPLTHWWWYLDVISLLPVLPVIPAPLENAA